MTTIDSTFATAPDLDQQLAEYLLLQEEDPATTPSRFAAGLPPARRAAFLDEVAATLPVLRCSALPRLPGYRFGACLGRGATAVVHAVERTGSSRSLAAKWIHTPIAGTSAAAALRHEAVVLQRLQHPAIVACERLESAAGGPVLVMARARGFTLRELLRQRADPAATNGTAVGRWFADPRAVLATFAQLAGALQHMHERGVVHRDLKPANVFVDPFTGAPTLVDFGLSRALAVVGAPASDVASAGDVVGTPLYMAPEQLVGDDVGPAADVWAWGLLLHECLTGEPARGPKATWRGIAMPVRRLLEACAAADPAARPDAAGLAKAVMPMAPRRLPALRRARGFAMKPALLAAV